MSNSNNMISESNERLVNDTLNTNRYMSYLIDEDDKLYESMSLDFITKFKNLLNSNIEYIDFLPIYTYKPEYVSYYLYGTPSYDYLVLHANKLVSKKEFYADKFINGKVAYYNKSILNTIGTELRNYKKGNPESIKTGNYLLYKI